MRVEAGFRYGRLTVIFPFYDGRNSKAMCICDCGKISPHNQFHLRHGRVVSCGCKRAEDFIKRATKHGHSQTAEYKIFKKITHCCSNPKLPEYPLYGGRGIKILYKDFDHFLADVGLRPEGFGGIERFNCDDHYMPGNCRWSKPRENRLNSRLWIVNGEIFDSSQHAALRYGINQAAVHRRCNGYVAKGKRYDPWAGWSSELKINEKEKSA